MTDGLKDEYRTVDGLRIRYLAWEEAPVEYGAIIAGLVDGGYLAGGTPAGRA